MVSKQSDRPYRTGRSCDWVKVQNRRHHAVDRVNRLLQARFDDGDGIDVGHGSSEADTIATKRGRDHVVAHHGHALDVRDAARRQPGVLPDEDGTKPPMPLIEARPGAMSAGTSISIVSSPLERTLPKLPLAMVRTPCGPLAHRSVPPICAETSPDSKCHDTRRRSSKFNGQALWGESNFLCGPGARSRKEITRPGWTGRVRC
jgi:hypothetical protein